MELPKKLIGNISPIKPGVAIVQKNFLTCMLKALSSVMLVVLLNILSSIRSKYRTKMYLKNRFIIRIDGQIILMNGLHNFKVKKQPNIWNK